MVRVIGAGKTVEAVVGSRSHFLTQSDAVSLHVRCSGVDPPAFAFIHGVGDGAFIWKHVTRALVDYGGMLALDLRGHGDSGPDPSGGYAIECHVEDVRTVLRQFATQPVVLFGHSVGAELAIRVAALDPERVRALVLVDGGPGLNPEATAHMRRELQAQPWLYESVLDYARLLERRLPMAEMGLVHTFAADSLKSDGAGAWRLKCDRQVALSDSDVDDDAVWHAFMQTRCPIQLVRGAFSAVLLRATAEKLVVARPNCILRTIPGAGHALLLERPDLLVSAVRQFVGGLTDR